MPSPTPSAAVSTCPSSPAGRCASAPTPSAPNISAPTNGAPKPPSAWSLNSNFVAHISPTDAPRIAVAIVPDRLRSARNPPCPRAVLRVLDVNVPRLRLPQTPAPFFPTPHPINRELKCPSPAPNESATKKTNAHSPGRFTNERLRPAPDMKRKTSQPHRGFPDGL